MNRPGRWFAFLVSVVVFIVLALKLFQPSPAASADPLLVYCAAGLRLPVEAAVKAYGANIQLQFQGSQTLLANAELTGKGDLFIPADDSYLKLAREKGLAAEAIPLARMAPVLAVAKGNPKGIKNLSDLLRKDVKVAQANPDAAAVGKLVRGALEPRGLWAALKEATLVFKPTVNDVANDLKLGTADAGFLWDATLHQYPDLDRVELPELAGVTASMSVVILRSSRSPTAALRFARFLAARDRGLPEFKRHGFEPVEGEAWEEKPTLLLYGGAMLKPAIEKTINAFKIREGCEVLTVYNGCGILVAQMQAGEKPDLYFACDTSFMGQVQDRFQKSLEISQNQLVILVPKGNPKGIKTLKDLGKPGLKIGIGHEKQCALGVITQETFRQTKTGDDVMKNVAVQSPTGDLLVNQMRTGSLDAVVAYISNAVSAADVLEPIAIEIPCAIAIQPVAVALESKRPQLAKRLVEALRSAESQQRFQNEGFRWKGTSEK